MTPAQSLLDPQVLAQAEALGLYARHVVEGVGSGDNRSPLNGFSVEFSQHREYAPGDDLRHIDWKILARTDRFFVKQYQQETNYHCQILLDASSSMSYGPGEAQKCFHAKRLAACIAYAVLKQRDSVSLRVFDEHVAVHVPTTSNFGSMNSLLRVLAAAEPRAGTNLPAVLHRVAGQYGRRGLVVIISDLFDDEDAILQGVRHLTFLGHEVVVFHTLHPDERNFNFAGPVKFSGLESPDQITVRPADVRRSYLNAFESFCAKIRGALEQNNCHYVVCDTGQPVHETLGAYLAFRARLGG